MTIYIIFNLIFPVKNNSLQYHLIQAINKKSLDAKATRLFD